MANNGLGNWTDDRIEQLKTLYAGGMTGSQIAAEMGLLTRNAVIGKIHRLGLDLRGKAFSKGPARPRKKSERKQKLPFVACEPFICADAPDVAPLHVSLLDLLPDDCRYPFGDGPFTFCGHPKLFEGSYCTAHADLCARETPQRRKYIPSQKESVRFAAGWV
jgi:GcrA cell cycle regulator